MSDNETPRPRAQYGEYASPEEQQLARGIPEPTIGAVQHGPPGGVHVPVAPQPYAAHPATAQPSGAVSPKPAHPVDRVVTIVLLAIGLFVLLNGIPGYLNLPQTMQMVYDQLDAGTYPARDVAASLGVTALVVQAILWIATAASSWAAMKRGRLAWWIPLLGGVLSFIATTVIVSIALFADPGFLDNLSPGNLPQP
jgi:hypothetical protein